MRGEDRGRRQGRGQRWRSRPGDLRVLAAAVCPLGLPQMTTSSPWGCPRRQPPPTGATPDDDLLHLGLPKMMTSTPWGCPKDDDLHPLELPQMTTSAPSWNCSWRLTLYLRGVFLPTSSDEAAPLTRPTPPDAVLDQSCLLLGQLGESEA